MGNFAICSLLQVDLKWAVIVELSQMKDSTKQKLYIKPWALNMPLWYVYFLNYSAEMHMN